MDGLNSGLSEDGSNIESKVAAAVALDAVSRCKKVKGAKLEKESGSAAQTRL